MPGCLILDCDGVLVDSELIASRVAAECFTAAGAPITTQEMVARFAGMKATDVTETVFAEHGLEPPTDATEQRRVTIMSALEHEVRAMPGIIEALDMIAVPKCVASSSHPDRIALSLRVAGLADFFGDAVFSSFMVERGKPAPDLFLLAAERMRTDASDCVVVEDSVAGVTAGIAAGMRVIGFTGGSHCQGGHGDRLVAAGASIVLTDMNALPAAIAG